MASSSGAPPAPLRPGPSPTNERPRRAWWAVVAAISFLGAGLLFTASGSLASGGGLAFAGVAVALLWGRPALASPGRPASFLPAPIGQDQPGSIDLSLDLDAIEVQAVYCLDREIFAHLRGGIGQQVDPVTGHMRAIETRDVSLTWRCAGQREAQKLANQLNYWEAHGTPLRLIARRGSCAFLIEDYDNWVSLPELRLAA